MRMLESIKDILKRPYFVFYSILLFFTPLIFVNNTNELFEFPKIYFLEIFGLFIMFFFIADVILNPVEIKRPHPSVSLLIILTGISTLLSSHFRTSFFGYYTRFNDALMSYLIFFGLYFVSINKLRKEDFEKIIKTTLFTIIPISIFGLSQYFGGTARSFSTLGQPNWLSQYLSMLLPILIYFSLKESPRNFRIWFILYVFGFLCFWVSYSLSGLFSFFAAVAFLSTKVLNGKNISNDFRKRIILISSISVLIALSNLGLYKDKIDDVFVDVKKQSVIFKKAYAQELENKLSDPGFIRLELWKSTLKLITSSPKIFIIGSGPETFPYVFQPFRSESLNYSSEWDFVFNKPHNYYLETWSESGIFTLVALLLIIYLVVFKSRECVSSSGVAFACSIFFGWPVVATSLLFWFILSSVSGSFLEKNNLLSKDGFSILTKTKRRVRVFILVPLWVSYLYIVYTFSTSYFADINFKKSQDLVKGGYHEEALYFADKAIKLNPNEPNYYRGRAKVRTVFLISSSYPSLVKELIFEDLKKAENLNPDNLVTIRNSIPIYYFLAVEDMYEVASENNVDEKYISSVVDYYEKTKQRYWNDVGVILAIAKYEKKLSQNKNYEGSVQRISELRPDLLEWYELFR